MYVRKKDENRLFWRGIVRAGDVVPEAVARAQPAMFVWTPDLPQADAEPSDVDSAWTMTEADFEDDSADRSDEPFEGYDDMSVRRITEAIVEMDLSAEELHYVRDYEVANKSRSTMLREIDDMIESLAVTR